MCALEIIGFASEVGGQGSQAASSAFSALCAQSVVRIPMPYGSCRPPCGYLIDGGAPCGCLCYVSWKTPGMDKTVSGGASASE